VILEIDQYENRMVRLGQLGDRAVDRGSYIDEIEKVAKAGMHGVDVTEDRRPRIDVSLVDLDEGAAPLAHPQERVPADGEEPSPRIAPWPKGVPSAKGAKIRLLHEIIGIRALARKRQREARDRLEVWQRGALEIVHKRRG
jgi:hypothetical protein